MSFTLYLPAYLPSLEMFNAETKKSSSRLVWIPEPRFVEFYNGTKKLPERRLSDLYGHSVDRPALELKVLVLNINLGYNAKLMEKAVAECIKNDILAQFLRKNQAEVIKVGIYEYDEELHMHQVWEDAKKEGIGISVENLMGNMGWSEEQAMEALKAPGKNHCKIFPHLDISWILK